ncbi:MAG: thiamine pyrophosphate-binding protein [Burkholderiaceae bacterium]
MNDAVPMTTTVTGRKAFLELLRSEGVTHLFGNPGTTELPIMHALSEVPGLHFVLGLQESIVIAMADGYARASGRLAACNVHVAPGLGNAMGTLYTAHNSGTPLIVTAGQQELGHGLTEPLLYGPLVRMAEPVSKWAVEVTRLADLPRIMRRAAKIAMTAPTGPVFISLPGDILNDSAPLSLGQPTRVSTEVVPTDAVLDGLVDALLSARAPAILAGHELATGDALAEAAGFASALGAPVFQQSVPQGAHFLSEHPLYMGDLSRTQSQVRERLAPYDMIVSLGADLLRMSVFSEVDPLPEGMRVLQLGLRDWEMGKNWAAEQAVRIDLRSTLPRLTERLVAKGGAALAARAAKGVDAVAGTNWLANRARKREAALARRNDSPLHPDWLVCDLVERLPANAVVVEEALTSSRSLLAHLPYRDRHSFYGNVSGGIGWAIGAAVGIQLALPDRRVIALLGDGSSMYSIQALWTAAHEKLPIVFLIANNGGYRIIKERLRAFHGSEQYIGMDFEEPAIDFSALAQSLGVPALRADDADSYAKALGAALARTDGPTLIEAMVEKGP